MVAAVLALIAAVFGFFTWLFMHGQNVTSASWVNFYVGQEIAGFICLFLCVVFVIFAIVALCVEGSDS